jgi:chromosome partitioning protein
VIREVRSHYGGKVFDTEVGHDPALEEAPTQGLTVFDTAPESEGARQYRAVVEEVVDRLDRYGSVYGKVNEEQANRV